MRKSNKNTARTRDIQDAPIQKILAQCDIPDDIISFGQGVPYFSPPSQAVSDGANAMANPEGYRYTSDAGIEELRQAIAVKLQRDNWYRAEPDENIMVTSGANQAFLNALLAITDTKDEVVILTPYYFNHVMAVQMAGCRPVLVHTEENYRPDLRAVESAINSNTRAVVTISPNNPTGAVFDRALLKGINELCAENNIYHISDETYEYFVFDGVEHCSPSVFDSGLDHTISLYSMSKSFGMPGYRVGYMTYPGDLHEDVLKVQDTIAICAPAPSQRAAVSALETDKDYLKPHLEAMTKVRNLFKTELNGLDGIDFTMTRGGFYFLVRLSTTEDDRSIAKRLIEDHGLITIPGCVFGTTDPSLRLSYGNVDFETASEGLERMAKALGTLL